MRTPMFRSVPVWGARLLTLRRVRIPARGAALVRSKRGNISLLAALIIPFLVGIMGLSIDVSYWSVVRMQMQRAADVASLAGAARYASTYSTTSALSTAANVLELNGFPSGTRGGDGTTTLTDTYGNYVGTISFVSPASIHV